MWFRFPVQRRPLLAGASIAALLEAEVSNWEEKKKQEQLWGSSRAGRKVAAGLDFHLWTAVWCGAAVGAWSPGEGDGLPLTPGVTGNRRAAEPAGPLVTPPHDPGAARSNSLITVVGFAESSSEALRLSTGGFARAPVLPALPGALYWIRTESTFIRASFGSQITRGTGTILLKGNNVETSRRC